MTLSLNCQFLLDKKGTILTGHQPDPMKILGIFRSFFPETMEIVAISPGGIPEIHGEEMRRCGHIKVDRFPRLFNKKTKTGLFSFFSEEICIDLDCLARRSMQYFHI